MDILSPEYGKSRIESYFKEDVIIRDYSKIKGCEDKYPTWGICVLAYSGSHNDMNVRIHYLPSNKINFEIEVNQVTILSSTWDNNEITESAYDYFVYIFTKIMKDISDTRNEIIKFQQKGWVELEQKLDKIL